MTVRPSRPVVASAPRPWGQLVPLVLATVSSQALLVVLGPTMVAIGSDLEASVGAVGQARAVTAIVAIATAVAIGARISRLGTARLLGAGALLAIVASVTLAASPNLAVFLGAHALVGIAFACLLSAGFAGVTGFAHDCRAWAMGWIAAGNALAWIAVNPLAGLLTEELSWRAAIAIPGVLALVTLQAVGLLSPSAGTGGQLGLGVMLRRRPTRRWCIAELAAYGAWSASLTFSGAFLIDRFGVGEATVGWVLALGPIAFVVASTQSAGIVGRFGGSRVTAASGLTLGMLLLGLHGAVGSLALAAVFLILVGVAAGLRTPASSGLGLALVPDNPGAIMAARTAITQLGYLIGAIVGGAVLTALGWQAFALALLAGMALSAAVVLGVADPSEGATRRGHGTQPAGVDERSGAAAAWTQVGAKPCADGLGRPQKLMTEGNECGGRYAHERSNHAVLN